jgi:hypothetical protein
MPDAPPPFFMGQYPEQVAQFAGEEVKAGVLSPTVLAALRSRIDNRQVRFFRWTLAAKIHFYMSHSTAIDLAFCAAFAALFIKLLIVILNKLSH